MSFTSTPLTSTTNVTTNSVQSSRIFSAHSISKEDSIPSDDVIDKDSLITSNELLNKTFPQSSLAGSRQQSRAVYQPKLTDKKYRPKNIKNYSQFSFLEAYVNSSPSGLCESIKDSELANICKSQSKAKGGRETFNSRSAIQPSSRRKVYEWSRPDLAKHLTKLAKVAPRVDTSTPKVPLRSTTIFTFSHRVRERERRESSDRLSSRSKLAKAKVDCWGSTQSLQLHPLEQSRIINRKKVDRENKAMAVRLSKVTPTIQTDRSAHLVEYQKSRVTGIRLRQFPSATVIRDKEFNPSNPHVTPAQLRHINTRYSIV